MASFGFNIRFRYLFGAVGFVALLLTCFCLAAPYWRNTSSQESSQIYASAYAYEGLWLSCVFEARNTQCLQMGFGLQGYSSSDLIYTYLNAFRAFMIIAFICSIAGVVCSALGMRCASMLEEDSKGKRWVVITGGILHIAAGVLTGISVSWYAAEVVREYYSVYYANQKMKYTLGACLYVGWVSMLFSLVCGCLMACCTCFSKPVDYDKQTYTYQPPAKEKYALPPTTTPAYRPVAADYSHQPDYNRSSSHRHGNSRHSRRSIDDSFRDSSRSSHSNSRRYDDSPKSSRHPSDIARASGFV